MKGQETVDIKWLLRRKRMLEGHLKIRNLRPTRRKKFEAELLAVNAYLEAITKQIQKMKVEQPHPVKLEEVAPEFKPAAEEANLLHEVASTLKGEPKPTAMLPTVFRVEKSEEEKA
jgi:hypothetical protein